VLPTLRPALSNHHVPGRILAATADRHRGALDAARVASACLWAEGATAPLRGETNRKASIFAGAVPEAAEKRYVCSAVLIAAVDGLQGLTDAITTRSPQATSKPVCGEFQFLRIERADRPLLAAWIPSATMAYARAGVLTYSSLCDDRQTPVARWCSFHHCRIAAAQASVVVLNRSRVRAPNLRPIDRMIDSLCAGLMRAAITVG
jgi:hypothetical protein